MRILFLILLLAIASTARADVDDTLKIPDEARPQEEAQPPDTLLFQPPQIESSAAEVNNPVDFEQHLMQQPTVALFKSMAIPGWGQLGNRRYGKALFFGSLEGWFIASAVHYGRQAADAREQYEATDDIAARNSRYDYYDNKRKNRNKFLWFTGLTMLVSMFDAYVDAHLSGSPSDKRNESFTFDLAPQLDGGVAMELAIHF